MGRRICCECFAAVSHAGAGRTANGAQQAAPLFRDGESGECTAKFSCPAAMQQQSNILVTAAPKFADCNRGTQALAQEVAHYLGMDLSPIKIKRFADGEIYVQVQACLFPQCRPSNCISALW